MWGTLPTHFDWCLPCGETGTASLILNIGLFVPFGIGLRLSGLRRRTAWSLALLLTVSIEMLQLYVVPGRDSDFGDIVANTVGAAIGVWAVDFRRLWMTPPARVAGRLTAVAALLICTSAAVVQWALAPSFPQSVYYGQIAPNLYGYTWFDGIVLDASFDRVRIVSSRMSAEASAAMRDSLLMGGAVIVATIHPGTIPGDIAPIAAVQDHEQREIFMLARHGTDLMFRLHRRTAILRVHTPSAVLINALPAQLTSTDTVVQRVTIEPGSVTFDVTNRGPVHPYAMHRRVGQGIWDAWRLLIPDDRWWEPRAQAATILSMILLFAPLGYWAGRAARREGITMSVTAILMPLAASLAIIPWAAGAPGAEWPIWAASIGGAALGWGVGRWIVGWTAR